MNYNSTIKFLFSLILALIFIILAQISETFIKSKNPFAIIMKKKHFVALLSIAILTSFTMKAQTPIKYPVTKKVDTIDNYFGTKVADPYRWLEDDKSAETAAWVKAENAVTTDYLASILWQS